MHMKRFLVSGALVAAAMMQAAPAAAQRLDLA